MSARLDLSTYLVTDAALSAPRTVIEVAREAVAGGATVVQLREKTATPRTLYQLTVAVADALDGRAVLLVDDRVDVFLAARAVGAKVHGVHVGQSDLPVAQTRAIVGPDAIVGWSASLPEHLAALAALPGGTVDYLGVGAIRPTRTKPDHPEPLGIDGFAGFVAESPLPCVAIGGVTVADTVALRRAGAAGLAVVSAVCAAAAPRAAAAELARAWTAAGREDAA